MCSEDTLLGLVQSIYAAADNSSLWQACLEKITDSLDGLCANLFCLDLEFGRANLQASARVDPADQRKYTQHFVAVDEWAARGRPFMKTGAVTTSELYCPSAVLVRSEFYNDFLRPMNIGHNLSGIIFNRESLVCLVTFYRSRTDGPFDTEHSATLSRLMPHLQRAIQLHRRITELEALSRARFEVLDLLPRGLILVNERGDALCVNRAAREILDRNDGLTLSRHGLTAARCSETVLLRRLVQAASRTSTGAGLASGGAIAISRPSLKPALEVLVAPLDSGAVELGKANPTAAIFVADPEARTEPDSEILVRLFGLTQAESRLAALLMQGLCVEDAADKLEVSRTTVRTHLQRIFQKTNTRRQGELVRLLLTSPAQLRSKRPPKTRCQ